MGSRNTVFLISCHFSSPEPDTRYDIHLYLLNEKKKEAAAGDPLEVQQEAPGGRPDRFLRGLEGCLWLVWGEHRKVRVEAPSQAGHPPRTSEHWQPPHNQSHRRRPAWPWDASSSSPGCPGFPVLFSNPLPGHPTPPEVSMSAAWGLLWTPLSKNRSCGPHCLHGHAQVLSRPGPSSEAPVCHL